MTATTLLLLYITFRIKHFACDFLLQTDWMALSKGKPGFEGYKALLSHTVIHALGTLFVMLAFAPALWWLGVVDFVVHSLVDRLKGMMTYKMDWKPSDTIFWWTFGLDQEAHNFTHLAYIVVVVLYKGGLLLSFGA